MRHILERFTGPAIRHGVSITIVGGGYSGASLAVQLVRAAGAPVAVTVVEPRAEPGYGVAYSTADRDHRLNGPLDNHMVDPTQPEGLRQWCERTGLLERDPEALASNGALYVRRGDFGSYVAGTVRAHAQTGSGSTVRHHRASAVGLATGAAGATVLLSDGAVLASDLVALATGNGGARLPAALADVARHPGVVADALDAPSIESLTPDARVFMLGSGLTALDVMSTLLRRGHRGPIVSLSRHGLRPRPQRPRRKDFTVAGLLERIEADVPGFVGPPPWSMRALTRALRQRIGEAQAAGLDWQGAFDELRNVVWQVWPRLPIAEKRRFLRHLRPWYDAHRFRVPPQNDEMVRAAEAAGRVAFHTGRLVSVEEAGGGALRVTWNDAASRGPVARDFDALVNCTGLDPSCGARDNPFLARLVADGILRPDATGIGFEVDAQCRPVSREGVAQARLRMIGPPTAGTFGDPLGVIFIAPQIRRMLPALLAEVGIPWSSGERSREASGT